MSAEQDAYLAAVVDAGPSWSGTVVPAKRGGLRVLNRAELAELPKPEPLIENTLDRRTVAVLAGRWGSCKSFIAQDWAACVATGKLWHGREVRLGRVVYVAAEGAYGLDQRWEAWEHAWNSRKPIDSDRLAVVPAPVNLMQLDQVAELCAAVAGADLVVIDTLARCLVGADENSARDVGIAVDSLYRIRDATGTGTVLALHHTGKDGLTIRGSSALEGGVDTVYKVDGDTQCLKLSRDKRKDGPKDDTLMLRLRDVPGTRSAVISSHVDVGLAGVQRDLLSHWQSHYSVTGASATTALETSGLAKSSFYRALNELVKAGWLVNQGTDKRPHYVLGTGT